MEKSIVVIAIAVMVLTGVVVAFTATNYITVPEGTVVWTEDGICHVPGELVPRDVKLVPLEGEIILYQSGRDFVSLVYDLSPEEAKIIGEDISGALGKAFHGVGINHSTGEVWLNGQTPEGINPAHLGRKTNIFRNFLDKNCIALQMCI